MELIAIIMISVMLFSFLAPPVAQEDGANRPHPVDIGSLIPLIQHNLSENSYVSGDSAQNSGLVLNVSDYDVTNDTGSLGKYLEWTSQSIFYDGSYWIVGGSDLVRMNISGGNSLSAVIVPGGYCRFLEPLGQNLILGGNYFVPPAGLYAYSYNILSGTLTNISYNLPSNTIGKGSGYVVTGMTQCDGYTFFIYSREGYNGVSYVQRFNQTSIVNVSGSIRIGGNQNPTAAGHGYIFFQGVNGVSNSILYNVTTGSSLEINSSNLNDQNGIDCPNMVAYGSGNFIAGSGYQIYDYSMATGTAKLLNQYPGYRLTFVSYAGNGIFLAGIFKNNHTTLLAIENDSFYDLGSYYGIVSDGTFNNITGGILLTGNGMQSGPVMYYLTPISTEVYFNEEGLPSGSEWGLNISGYNNMTLYGNSTEISQILDYGNYHIRPIYPLRTFYAPEFNLSVNYQGISVLIQFKPYDYILNVSETGLPSGTLWYLNFTEDNSSNKIYYHSYSTSQNVMLQNGTYNYSISSSLKCWISFDGDGKINIYGNDSTLNIPFLRAYKVSFNLIFPAKNQTWYLNISLDRSHFFNITGNLNRSQEYLPNGTFNYSAATANKKYHSNGGNFSVMGENITVNVTYLPYLYVLSIFRENGIYVGKWGVFINDSNVFYNTSSSELNVSLMNGTYDLRFTDLDKRYIPKILTMNITINGSDAIIRIHFEITYAVSFSLSEHVAEPWNVYIYNNTANLSGFIQYNLSNEPSSICILLPNGSYHYAPEYEGKGIIFNVSSIYFNLTGSDQNIQVIDYNAYPMEISSTGLFRNMGWYVNLSSPYGGKHISPYPNLSIYYCLPNGTYTYVAGGKGNIFNHPSGNVTIDGKNSSVNLAFVPVTYPVIIKALNPAFRSFNINFINTGIISELINNNFSMTYSGLNIEYLEDSLVNGTYWINATLSNGTYSIHDFKFSVNGSSETVYLNLLPVLYRIEFIPEAPSGSSGNWEVDNSSSSINSPITLYEINGTYNYNISAPPSLLVSNSSGEYAVNGKNITIYVYFKGKNQIQIIETQALNEVSEIISLVLNSYMTLLILAVIIISAATSFRAYRSIRTDVKKGTK